MACEDPKNPPAGDSPPTGWKAEPADPDTAVAPLPHKPGRTPRREQADILLVIAAGGVLGAFARYGATLIWPTPATGFPWTTFLINVTGCAAMGVLMVLITERLTVHPLVRPFLGTGVLGGYTTFSSYILDAHRLLENGHGGTALLYLAATLTAALAAIWTTVGLTRLVVRPRSAGTAGEPATGSPSGQEGRA
ncbi:CrcB family protein [Streptomyces sp. SL13]|uniref:Fluoride-specific ion channel FluC n=1 Tax=Streptantibioticus silvisoli TaxID=2705255 RepID=A0AA90GZQ4_9ACTN|nr:CrcB family protein [Streptantibioticus silvisoli]MDI5967795.1 CrcB family protein [Streptantibioticus silvisoli]